MFQPVESNVSFPQMEEAIVGFWRQQRIYEQSLAAREGAAPFVFYEGPPTANGLPHPGHCLTRAIKDLFPRYRTMRGYRCERKAGWDTHGLPVEVEVCKELGIHSKEEIERFGVEPFIRKCIESVFRYTREWEQLTERLGFWIHLDDAYVTFHQSYVESVWWALKNLFDRGLLYQGHKIVWWWAQGGTALSSGEVGQGYREVADPSVYVRFPVVGPVTFGKQAGTGGKATGNPPSPPAPLPQAGEGRAVTLPSPPAPTTSWCPPLAGEGRDAGIDLLVWTTTPWTLPSNQFAAVKPDLEYSLVEVEGEPRKLILASALVEQVMGKAGKKYQTVGTMRGEQLVGCRYLPPFNCYYKTQGDKRGKLKAGGAEHIAWRVVAAEFVTVDTGTGVVHQAPAFGEVDFDVLLAEQALFVEGEGPPLICSVAPDGTFTAEAPDYQGRWVKDCDRDIIRAMKQRGVLFHQEQYVHDYPFCWRADEDPLIQYPRKSWFIRTTKFKQAMLANNGRINWLPEHIRDGRFGNFLETNVDWALSRERYWGTPLPIWVCEQTGRAEAVASYAELLAKPGVQGTEVWRQAKQENPGLPDDLMVHKPYIDAVTYDSPWAKGARMRRVSEVIDCWFDSGAMPFAQWGYPHRADSAARFRGQFPADFISEALDQTRGWFYSLLAISTLLFGAEEDGGLSPFSREKTSTPEDVQRSLPSPASGGHHEVVGAGGEGGQPQLARELSDGSSADAVNAETGKVPFPHPFRNCIVLGLMLGEDGGKMSKSKRNYREPQEIFDRYGADALRWYFFANQPPWTSIRYSEQAIKDCVPEFLLRLWHVYSFFVIYANIDGFDPAAEIANPGQLDAASLASGKSYGPVSTRRQVDRWILSELSRTTAAVVERMDAFDNFAACQRLTEFVDALSNWFVRLGRDRYWSGERSRDKADAYWTLYECLLTTCKLVAPFVPFVAEQMWQNLAVAAFAGRPAAEQPPQSVHLCDYPQADPHRVDGQLAERMALAREIVSLGRAARMGAKLKVRQPLACVEVILADRTHQPWLEEHARMIAAELNVKEVQFTQEADHYISYNILPDLKRLGPRLGKRLPAVRKLLAESDGGKLLAELAAKQCVALALPDGPVTLDADDIQVRLQAKPGWAAAQGHAVVVVLATELTDDLLREGLAREIVRTIQDRRKDLNCQFTDRIRVAVVAESAELRSAIAQFADYIRGETLAVELVCCDDRQQAAVPGAELVEADVAGHAVALYVGVVA
jgi:isoleucyl-tRNA synthetase